ncbi:MAG TPA: D-aminoacyl-tRNA deacylase [Ignavibacteriaceae bacterium]|nr:D-aminoacyl-tRNA deacylase [Ignavibacteriaceae bacterium]
MRALVQRVSEGGVYISANNYSADIKRGLVILLGIKTGDTIEDSVYIADKCTNLRVFEDSDQKMNISLKDISGEVLIISQFTLYGDTSKGNRPGFTDAAKPDEAIPLYEKFIKRMKENLGERKVKTGIFGAMMQVIIVNDGPVTLLVESKET